MAYTLEMNLDEIKKYSIFLKKMSKVELDTIEKILRANNVLQSTMQDNLIEDINIRIVNLKRIFTNFSKQVDVFSEKMKKMCNYYYEYSKKI